MSREKVAEILRRVASDVEGGVATALVLGVSKTRDDGRETVLARVDGDQMKVLALSRLVDARAMEFWSEEPEVSAPVPTAEEILQQVREVGVRRGFVAQEIAAGSQEHEDLYTTARYGEILGALKHALDAPDVTQDALLCALEERISRANRDAVMALLAECKSYVPGAWIDHASLAGIADSLFPPSEEPVT